jgi:hypothetical protein
LAQQEADWATPQRIPNYEIDTWPPVLIGDQNGTVHAFSSQWLASEGGVGVRAIVYNHWALTRGWTAPVDILLSPIRNDARLLDVFLDQTGRAHLVFWGGDGTEARIYYASAAIAEAGRAGAWSGPTMVAEYARDPEAGVIYADDHGAFTILFSGRQAGNGLYMVRSEDGGHTWSKPELIFNTNDRSNFVQILKIARSASGAVHAIWNEATPAGEGRGIFYSKKSTNDTEWSAPIQLSLAEAGYGTNTPAIVVYQDRVLAFFNLASIIWQRSSTDGTNWTLPTQVFARHVGVNGSIAFVTDANDTLHMFFAQRISGPPDIHGMWHSVFGGVTWSEPEAIVSGPQVADHQGNTAFDPFEARAVLSHDNVLLVTWRNDPGLQGNGVWYSYQRLAAPEMSAATPPTALPATRSTTGATATPSETPMMALTSNATPQPGVEVPTGSSAASNPARAAFMGILPVLVVIAIVLIRTFVVQRQRS